MTFKIRRVSALPKPAEANTVYLVFQQDPGLAIDGITEVEMNGLIADGKLRIVVSGADATILFNSPSMYDVVETANYLIVNALSAFSAGAEYVADIAERDALTPRDKMLVFVEDASADETITSGFGFYFYRGIGEVPTYIKLAPSGGSSLSPEKQAILDNLSDVNGELYYRGEPIAAFVSTNTIF